MHPSSQVGPFFTLIITVIHSTTHVPSPPPRVAADEEIKINDGSPNSIREPLEPRAVLHEI